MRDAGARRPSSPPAPTRQRGARPARGPASTLPFVANVLPPIGRVRRRAVRRVTRRALGWLAARDGRPSTAPVKLLTVAHPRGRRVPAAAPAPPSRGRSRPALDPASAATVVAGPGRARGRASRSPPRRRGRRRRARRRRRPRASPRWRSSPPRSAAWSAARGRSPTTAGATTPTRSARPAPASPPSSTSRAASRARSSTGSGRWRRRASSRSTPIPPPTWCTKADYAVIGDLHEVVPAITAELRAAG